jgi:Gtp-binding protein of the ras superfamily involved in termination of M-phase
MLSRTGTREFDLTIRYVFSTISIGTWEGAGQSMANSSPTQTAIPILVGTKYDIFAGFPEQEQEDTIKQARRFAHAMKAPLVFSSTSHAINIQKIFKIVVSRVFDLKLTIPKVSNSKEPILEY